jgi:phage terminase large subunit
MGKRLSLKVIQELEDRYRETTAKTVSAVFGVCGMDGAVIRSWQYLGGIPEPTDAPASIMIPERLEKLLFPKRRIIIYGGRGSAKTRTITAWLTEMARHQTERVLCLREVLKSIDDSSYQELADEINRKPWADEFRCINNKISVPAKKSTFKFEGMRTNASQNLKAKAGSSKAWVDEAETVSRDAWDALFPTMRKKGSQIIISFNPREETDPTWADLVAPYVDQMVDGIYEDDETLIIECNWQHNPWFTEELRGEKDRMARTDPDRYMWIWEGKFRRRTDVKVLNGKWIVEAFEPVKGWDGPYFGADFGFSQDPSTLNKLWINNRKLYVEYEANGVGIELDDMFHFYAGEDGASDDQKEYLAELKRNGGKIHPGIPGARHYNIKADCARPETIAHIKKRQFRIEGVEKWPGSVEDGITFLRSFEQIVIHPRCKNTIFEANAYEYKTDRLTGDILPDIVDKHNHHWDAIRYALDKLIKRRGMSYYDY